MCGPGARERKRAGVERVRALAAAGAIARTCELLVYACMCACSTITITIITITTTRSCTTCALNMCVCVLVPLCACGARRCRKRFLFTAPTSTPTPTPAMRCHFFVAFAFLLFYKFNSTNNYYIIAHTKRYIRNGH